MWSTELTAPKTGESGLLELTREAYDQFQARAVREGWIYERFTEYFLSGIDNTDAIDAASRNEHQRNVATVTTLLTKRTDLVEDYFTRDSLSDEELHELIHLLNTTHASSSPESGNPSAEDSSTPSHHSLHPCLHREEYVTLAACCNRVGMFTEYIPTIELVSLLNGTKTTPVCSANNRLVSYFFHGLSERRLVTGTWQSVLSAWGIIYSSSAKAPLKKEDFSSALYNITSVSEKDRPSRYKDMDDTLDEVMYRNRRKRSCFK